ncbi:hypothetical protein [Streptomyces sp. NBC_00046]|uniref:hypothetical protein n=1 Tax=Streptomyces sp. NBC_00046 TaxID=2975626 RepID=UPI003243F242
MDALKTRITEDLPGLPEKTRDSLANAPGRRCGEERSWARSRRQPSSAAAS